MQHKWSKLKIFLCLNVFTNATGREYIRPTLYVPSPFNIIIKQW